MRPKYRHWNKAGLPLLILGERGSKNTEKKAKLERDKLFRGLEIRPETLEVTAMETFSTKGVGKKVPKSR